MESKTNAELLSASRIEVGKLKSYIDELEYKLNLVNQRIDTLQQINKKLQSKLSKARTN